MPSFLDDVTTGLKGIRGAGDALRGELMEAVDHAFDSNSSHATTAADVTKNQATAEKGKADMKAADEMVARHEQAHRDKKAGVAAAGTAGTAGTAEAAFSGSGAQTGAAPVATHETTSDAYGSGAAAPATAPAATEASAGQGQVPVGQAQTQAGAPGTATAPVYSTGHPVA